MTVLSDLYFSSNLSVVRVRVRLCPSSSNPDSSSPVFFRLPAFSDYGNIFGQGKRGQNRAVSHVRTLFRLIEKEAGDVRMVDETAVIYSGGVAMVAAMGTEVDVPTPCIILIPDALTTAGTRAGVILQTIGADELVVKFLQLVYTVFPATDGADVFLFVHLQCLHKISIK